MPRSAAPRGACDDCLLPPPPKPWSDSGELPPFEWPRTPGEIEVVTEQILAAAKASADAVAAVPIGELTFANVIAPLMKQPNYKTNPLVCQAKHMQHCSTDGAIREAASSAAEKLAACKKDIKNRSDVYQNVKAFSETDEAKGLSEYDAHFMKAILSDFERGGVSLSDEKKAQLRSLLDEDVQACSKYSRNLSEDKTRLMFTVEELDGCEESFIKERIDKETGKVVLTLKYPDIIPVGQNCAVGSTRQQVSIARESAYGDNLEHMAKGIGVRKQIAEMLGYPSWAHFVTENRMSGSPDRILPFLESIRAKAAAGAALDKERLRLLKVTHLEERGEMPEGGASAVTLEPWDTSFYHSMLLKREHGVDHEANRKYFPLNVVVEGTLSIYQDLLGLSFAEVKDFDSWHKEVRLFKVDDRGSGDRVGHFYLDLHPRDGKYGHAAIFHLLKRCTKPDGSTQTPVDCMLCNLPGPAPDGSPALLRHDDVVTFFHEFGHIMHGLCAEGEGNATRLAKCPRDFVEAPSQMLENWCFNTEVLKRLSRHAETGEPMPEDKAKALLAAKNVDEGFFMLRQIYLASLDLALHGESPPDSVAGIQALVDEMRPRISLVDNPPGCNMLRNFGHLMNQYSAAYYGYLWAEVISADMFATRFEADPFSQESGMAYRKQVLAVGGVGKIANHLEKFLSRAPTEDAFLRARGILQ